MADDRNIDARTYRIERLEDGTWTSSGIGDATGYGSPEAALAAIESLRGLGVEWLGQYCVVCEQTDDLAGEVTLEWTYEGYWNTVLGPKNAGTIVHEYDLGADSDGLDEWLGTAEEAAWSAGGLGGDLPDEWAGYHRRALEELAESAARS